MGFGYRCHYAINTLDYTSKTDPFSEVSKTILTELSPLNERISVTLICFLPTNKI